MLRPGSTSHLYIEFKFLPTFFIFEYEEKVKCEKEKENVDENRSSMIRNNQIENSVYHASIINEEIFFFFRQLLDICEVRCQLWGGAQHDSWYISLFETQVHPR